jgi:hypothetical protein
VSNSTALLNVTATAANAGATIQVRINGGAYGPPGGSLSLNVGTNAVNVKVTAQDGLTVRTYAVSVTRRTPYGDWAAGHGLGGANSAPNADFDRDGMTNVLEWAFGTNPANSSTDSLAVDAGAITKRGAPTTLAISDGQGGVIHFAAFGRRKDYVALGLTYTVLFSSDLGTWTASPAEPNVIADDGEIEIVTIPYPAQIDGQPAGFFHVIVTAP